MDAVVAISAAVMETKIKFRLIEWRTKKDEPALIGIANDAGEGHRFSDRWTQRTAAVCLSDIR
jgi:hypothetical protein